MPLTYERVKFGGIGANGQDTHPPAFVECAIIPGDPLAGVTTCDVISGYRVDLSLAMADLLAAAGVPPGGVTSPYGPVYYYVKCQAAENQADTPFKGCYDPAIQGPWTPGTSSCGPPDTDISTTLDVAGGTGLWFGGPEGLDATHAARSGTNSFVRFLAWMVNPTVHPDAIDTGLEGITEFSVPYVLPASAGFLFHELPATFSMTAGAESHHGPASSILMQLFVMAPTAPVAGERTPGAFTTGPAVAGVLRESHRVVGSAKVGASASAVNWDGFSDGVGSATPSEAQSGIVRP